MGVFGHTVADQMGSRTNGNKPGKIAHLSKCSLKPSV